MWNEAYGDKEGERREPGKRVVGEGGGKRKKGEGVNVIRGLSDFH